MESGVLFRNVCLNYGIRFWIGSEEINLNDSNDRLNIGFRSLISEDERYRIRERMMIGKKNKLEKGLFVSGNLGYGYKKVDGLIKVNEEESKFVKWIYKIFLYKNVKSYNDVYLRLKNRFEKNYDEKVGRSLIVKILKNKRYLGEMSVRFGGDNYEYQYESIIDRETFLEVSDKIKVLNSLRKRKSSEKEFLLKSNVYCSDCKELMWVVGSNIKLSGNKEVNYRYYSCNNGIKSVKSKWNNKNLEESCNSLRRNKIRVDKLENIVWNILFDVLYKSEDVLEEYKEKYKGDRIKEKEYRNKIKYYEKKIEKDENNFLKKLDILIENNISLDKKLKLEFEKEKLKDEKSINELKEFISKLELLDNEKLVDERIKDELNVIYSDSRFKNRYNFINKYIDSVEIKRLNSEIRNVNYNIVVRFKFGDSLNNFKNLNKEENKNISLIDNKFVYKLKVGDMELSNLVYKDFKFIDILFNIEIRNNKDFIVEYLSYKIL